MNLLNFFYLVILRVPLQIFSQEIRKEKTISRGWKINERRLVSHPHLCIKYAHILNSQRLDGSIRTTFLPQPQPKAPTIANSKKWVLMLEWGLKGLSLHPHQFSNFQMAIKHKFCAPASVNMLFIFFRLACFSMFLNLLCVVYFYIYARTH